MLGQDTEIRLKDEKIKITSHGKTQFKGNKMLLSNNKKMTNKKSHIKPTTKHWNPNILNKFYNAHIKSKYNTQT